MGSRNSALPDAPAATRVLGHDDDEPLLARLARRLRKLRAERGMTRRQLAEQSGVSLPHIARIEGGEGNVSVLLLDKLAQALNCPLAEVVADDRAGDEIALINEFLHRQPAQRLGTIRHWLVEEFATAPEAGDRRIALVGLRGAGKSTVSALLAKRLDLPVVELNREIEREAGLKVHEIFTLYGQTGFRQFERRCLERVLAQHRSLVLATAGGIVAERPTYELLLRHCTTVWLKAAPEAHFARVAGQNDARIANQRLRREALNNINRTLTAREDLYRMANLCVDTTGLSPEAVAREIAARLTK
ncbi:shikimate kinase [Derxia gummosa]|uniref:Shikimate kinase n=1 Tax=Derxia gummosa DSM 723 TaxID=1121388 RepID=A0A8B6X5J5_9BURK|nr:shikimate kinase [Derxia gummosa]